MGFVKGGCIILTAFRISYFMSLLVCTYVALSNDLRKRTINIRGI